jgi:RHS repeat-associated protein
MKERLYLGGFEIYREYRSDTVKRERETLHIMDDTQRIALVETRTVGAAANDPGPAHLVRYEFGNHLGSASLELDDKARVISYEEYTPFGSTSYQALSGQTESPKRYRYSGKERDDCSGLYYYGARYYAPWLCRWMSPDPAGTVDGLNLYAFVRGNPVRFTDYFGLNADDVAKAIGKTASAGGSKAIAAFGNHGRAKNLGLLARNMDTNDGRLANDLKQGAKVGRSVDLIGAGTDIVAAAASKLVALTPTPPGTAKVAKLVVEKVGEKVSNYYQTSGSRTGKLQASQLAKSKLPSGPLSPGDRLKTQQALKSLAEEKKALDKGLVVPFTEQMTHEDALQHLSVVQGDRLHQAWSVPGALDKRGLDRHEVEHGNETTGYAAQAGRLATEGAAIKQEIDEKLSAAKQATKQAFGRVLTGGLRKLTGMVTKVQPFHYDPNAAVNR